MAPYFIPNSGWQLCPYCYLLEADFVYLKERTKTTSGNLSVQIDKLSEAGYIEVERGFVGKRTRTVCKITEVGIKAFEKYVESLKGYLNL